MKNFKEFEIETPEMILGGRSCLIRTDYSDGTNTGTDMYDSCRDAIIYFPSE